LTIRIEIFGADAHDTLEQLAQFASGMLYAVPVSDGNTEIVKQAELNKPAPVTDPDVPISINTVNVLEEAPAAPKRRGRPPKAKVEDTGTKEAGEESSPTNTAMSETVDESVANEDDEFAAFKNAMEKADADDDKAAASVPARKWTDADLSALNNQAAQKVRPARVPEIKAIVAKYVPDGEVPHSRNIPEGDRATYAREIEELAGIEFAG
jgi:hypothetical protein